MNCRKVVLLDENTIYPNCHICKKELSPYEIEEKLSYETLELLKLSGCWLWEKEDKHTILICPNCIKLTKEK